MTEQHVLKPGLAADLLLLRASLQTGSLTSSSEIGQSSKLKYAGVASEEAHGNGRRSLGV